MPTPTVEFIFDFASPNAYLVHKTIDGLVARTGISIEYIPCLLGGLFKSTGNQAPFITFAEVPKKLAYEQLELERYVIRHGLSKYQMNPNFPVNTLLLMRAFIAAKKRGELEQFIEIAFKAMWEDGKKMDDPETFVEVFTDGGLDGQTLLEATQDSEVKREVIDNTQRAADRGAFGIPTFFFGEEMFFGKERLGQLEELIVNSITT